jgi:peptide/nickel transport system substrate-binding protein
MTIDHPLRRARLDRRTLLKATGGAGAAAALTAGHRRALAGPSHSRPRFTRWQRDADTLIIAVDGSPSDLDPHAAYDYRSLLAIAGIYEGLIGLVGEHSDVFEGRIAESWEANEDKSVWSFHIRPGATFHDGSPIDAEAVRLSYERILTLALGPVGVLTRFVSDPAQITTPDETTVVFDLGKPQPLFEAAMASGFGPLIMNAALLREHDAEGDWGHFWAQTNAEGTGSGPYRLVRNEPGHELELEAYEGYWRGWEGAHFRRIILRTVTENETRRQLIEQGEVDLVDSLTFEAIEALQDHPDVTTMIQFVTRSDYFTMAVAGPFETPEARRAMCFAFPYDEVVNGVYNGHVRQSRGGVPHLLRGHDPETFQYTTDLDQAQELLAIAGVPEGTELSIIMEPGIEEPKAIAQLFQSNLQQLGLDLRIDLVDTSAMLSIVYGDTPVEERPNFMPWFWWPEYNDAWTHLRPQISCDAAGSAGANMGFYCNERVEELMVIARDAPDDETYQEAMSEIQQIINFDDPAAIYYAEIPWTVLHRDTVEGIVINPVTVGTYDFWGMQPTG